MPTNNRSTQLSSTSSSSLWMPSFLHFLAPLRRACLLLFVVVLTSCLAAEDLYQTLGVKRSATTQEIKQAYRRKARDTHPDKNKGVPPDEAAEAFRKVVHAFEVLSDDSSRKHYDRTGRDSTSNNGFGGGGGGGGGRQQYGGGGGGFHFSWNFRQAPRKLKDKFEVKQAMSRVLHIVSLEQLQTVMLDENDLLERHLLMCIVTPGKIETHADEEIVFPYPFAAMSSQGIWWEDLLQTVKIRFNRENALSRFFNIPHGDEIRKSGEPLFLFAKKGEELTADTVRRFSTTNRAEFENWVWTQLEVQLKLVNNHPHPIEIYWIHGSSAKDRGIAQPGETKWFTTMLAHEWYIRDVRVDSRKDSPGRYKLTTESSLGSWKIGVEGPASRVLDTGEIEIIIEPQSCFDLSGHCKFWQYQGECKKNPGFMEHECRLTCGLCKRDKTAPLHQEDDEL